jgi:hypothetical protein
MPHQFRPFKNLVRRYEDAQRVWKLVVPQVPLPPRETFVVWLGNYSDEVFEKGVLMLSTRLREQGLIDPESAYRVVSSNLKNYYEYRQRKVTGSRRNHEQV